MIKKINIIPGDPPTVGEGQGEVHVSKGNQDRVKWESTSNDWAVVFVHDTPFELHYFSSGHPETGKITGSKNHPPYKYTIYVDGNSADPIIIVDE